MNKDPLGGELRLHLCDRVNNDKSLSLPDKYLDIEAKFGRLIIFQSDIEHEVLPTYNVRLAITVWASGYIDRVKLNRNNYLTCENRESNVTFPLASYDNKPDSDLIKNSTIFISIAAYRDEECKHTVNSLLQAAVNPYRLYLGIVWQYNEGDDGDCIDANECRKYFKSPTEFNSHIRILKMNYLQAKGPCFARHIATSLWQGEQYFLQIDSHMRFRANWDSFLIHELELARNHKNCIYNKPILTTYPLSYELPNKISKDIR